MTRMHGPHFHFMLPETGETKKCALTNCKCIESVKRYEIPVQYRGRSPDLTSNRSQYQPTATLHVYLCKTHGERTKSMQTRGWDYLSAFDNFVEALEENA